MLRSCYTTDMRFYADRPDVLTRVRWFFVAERTPFLGVNNVFTSRNWADKNDVWPVLGEVQGASRPWRDGSAPDDPPRGEFCGNGGEFVEGVPFARRGSLPTRPDGQLVCCAGVAPITGSLLVTGFIPEDA